VPSIEENLNAWNAHDSWEREGDEWSDSWKSPVAMWFGTILPRIGRRLPTGTILEIACGRGRVTSFLLDQCDRYVGVDLAPNCVEICAARFSDRTAASFHATDGKSLPMVEDESIDFAVSWDSLVHADHIALRGYLRELATKLRPGGHAFLHHSNLGAFVDEAGVPSVENPQWRDSTTSGRVVHELCAEAGLLCVSQELVQWGLAYHGDCFTMLRRSRVGEIVDVAAPPTRFENPHFPEEIGYTRMLAKVYEPHEDEDGDDGGEKAASSQKPS